MNNLQILIRKLDTFASRSLEAAVGFCAARSHYNVEIEHWLMQLLESCDSEFYLVLDYFSVDKELLRQDILSVLADIRTGNTRTASLAPDLVTWLEQAWSCASLEFNFTHITSGILLYTLLNNEILARKTHGISTEFTKINRDELRDQFAIICTKSSENSGRCVNLLTTNANSNNTLQQFTINLTEEASQGKIDPVIGRENEIRQIIDILLRRRQNNPILTGEAGVGKTAVVEGLALRIVKQDVPTVLKNVQIHVLDLALLQAGASIKGEFENRLKSVITAVKQSPYPIILFIDEAHNLIGAGNQAGQGDAANLLKPALARGELRTIAATTWAEYKKFFEKDAALARRFQVIKIEEPDEITTIAIMRGMLKTLETHHKVRILDEALLAAVHLSKRYLTSKQLPDKAISLLDTACARVKLNQSATPAAIENCQANLIKIQDAQLVLERESQTGANHSDQLKSLSRQNKQVTTQLIKLQSQWKNELGFIEKINQLHNQLADAGNKKILPKVHRQLIRKLHHYKKQFKCADEVLMQTEVNTQTITEVIGSWTGIPVGKMLGNEVENLLNLEGELRKRVIGQDHALKTIVQSIHTARTNLGDPRKPLGVFLLVGSSGIGKTETALALADILYGGRQSLTVINMSEFKEEHKISMLTGSPAGYIGYGDGGLLTEAVRRRPYSVILLDEIEKAHRGIQDIFLQVFDKGMLFDGEGREVNFKNTIILMTSNIGAETIISANNISLENLKEKLKSDLLHVFKPAFLSRLTLVPYLPLDIVSLQNIIKLQFSLIEQRIARHYDATLEYDASFADYIIQNCQQIEGGARNIENLIANQLLPQLSSSILQQFSKGEKIKAIRVNMIGERNFAIDLL